MADFLAWCSVNRFDISGTMLTPKRFGSIRYLILVTVMRFFLYFGYHKIFAPTAAAAKIVAVAANLLGKTGSILNAASGNVSRPNRSTTCRSTIENTDVHIVCVSVCEYFNDAQLFNYLFNYSTDSTDDSQLPSKWVNEP